MKKSYHCIGLVFSCELFLLNMSRAGAVIKIRSRTVGVSPSIQLDMEQVRKIKEPMEVVEEEVKEEVKEAVVEEEVKEEVKEEVVEEEAKEAVEVNDISLNTQETEETELHDYDRILSRGKLMLEGIRPIVKDVLNQLVDHMREQQLNVSPQTMIILLKQSMEIVEKTALKGIQKRELVNEMLLHIIEASPLSDEQREVCKLLIDNNIIGDTVDLIVNATKGTLKINHIEQLTESTKSCCFAFLSRNRK